MCEKPGHVNINCVKWKGYNQIKPGNAARVPDISDTARDQHLYPGILIKGKEKKSVTVLRDTGSAVHAVHSNLVSDGDYTGTYQKLVTFGGKEESFPLAYIEVNTPFLTGRVIACVLQSYPEKCRYFDILIGNGGTLESPIAADSSPVLDNPYSIPFLFPLTAEILSIRQSRYILFH